MSATPKASQLARDTLTVLAAAGLRPVLDVELDRVLADCPACDAGAGDPLGMYRALAVACFGTGPGPAELLRGLLTRRDTHGARRAARSRGKPWRTSTEISRSRPSRISSACSHPPRGWRWQRERASHR